eukprot:IDg18473t1
MEQLAKKQSRPNPKNVYYVLNPGGDLPRTEKKFRNVFEKRRAGKECLARRRSMMITSRSHQKQEAPVAVLMGCSSAKLIRYSGYRGSSGTPLDYLLHGAPAVVGNLWDVTDKDIDRLTAAFLKQWLGVSASARKTTG